MESSIKFSIQYLRDAAECNIWVCSVCHSSSTLRKQAYLNILKILPQKKVIFLNIEVGFKGVNIIEVCFRDEFSDTTMVVTYKSLLKF